MQSPVSGTRRARRAGCRGPESLAVCNNLVLCPQSLLVTVQLEQLHLDFGGSPVCGSAHHREWNPGSRGDRRYLFDQDVGHRRDKLVPGEFHGVILQEALWGVY